jgi:hypothetical protein
MFARKHKGSAGLDARNPSNPHSPNSVHATGWLFRRAVIIELYVEYYRININTLSKYFFV